MTEVNMIGKDIYEKKQPKVGDFFQNKESNNLYVISASELRDAIYYQLTCVNDGNRWCGLKQSEKDVFGGYECDFAYIEKINIEIVGD